jgi:hypothetical protein
MVNPGWQLRMKRHVERLITGNRKQPVRKVEQDLHALGFVQLGADQVAVAFEHVFNELYLEIELDDEHRIHGYFIVPFTKKREEAPEVPVVRYGAGPAPSGSTRRSGSWSASPIRHPFGTSGARQRP